MSRSVKNRHDKNGVFIKYGNSNKKDKRIANKKFRRRESMEEKETLLSGEDHFFTTDIKDVSNVYDFSSDGLSFYFRFYNTKGRFRRGPIEKDEQYYYRKK